ncbi:hypothetical protein LMH73_011870 [Vibrio splendidus]|nr:hypothetical protein [Vibrio splendidus]MCC4881553.1 hypothetical protein [Vibrio splendidus]
MLKSREFAHKAHSDQLYGERPYMFHVDGVAQIIIDLLSEHKYFPVLLDAAYLHDVPEDTQFKLPVISAVFGLSRSQPVGLLTDEDGENRKERKQKTYAKFRNEPVLMIRQIAATVKYADRFFNIHQSYQEWLLSSGEAQKRGLRKLKMYAGEHVEFKLVYGGYILSSELRDKLDSLVKEINER